MVVAFVAGKDSGRETTVAILPVPHFMGKGLSRWRNQLEPEGGEPPSDPDE